MFVWFSEKVEKVASAIEGTGLRAMRDIAAGEELTFDYATGDDDDWEMECRCGAATCRGRATGQDWRLPELQERYDGWFSPYLARKIAASRR